MMMTGRTTPAPTVRPGDVKIAPMLKSPYLVEGTLNPINLLYYLHDARSMVAQLPSFTASEAAHRYVLDEVRQADRDRFLAALFAPEPQRRGPFSPLAFAPELSRGPTRTPAPR